MSDSDSVRVSVDSKHFIIMMVLFRHLCIDDILSKSGGQKNSVWFLIFIFSNTTEAMFVVLYWNHQERLYYENMRHTYTIINATALHSWHPRTTSLTCNVYVFQTFTKGVRSRERNKILHCPARWTSIQRQVASSHDGSHCDILYSALRTVLNEFRFSFIMNSGNASNHCFVT